LNGSVQAISAANTIESNRYTDSFESIKSKFIFLHRNALVSIHQLTTDGRHTVLFTHQYPNIKLTLQAKQSYL